MISTLLYADDIVLITENEKNMQSMLNCLDNWSKKWRMVVNMTKTNVIHFRPTSAPISNYNFKIGEFPVTFKTSYKYLGIFLDEHLNFKENIDTLTDAAGRALGKICSTFRENKNFGFKTFSTLFFSCVAPVIDYASGIWGCRTRNKSEIIQNRAMRFFLGVNKFTPLHAINQWSLTFFPVGTP